MRTARRPAGGIRCSGEDRLCDPRQAVASHFRESAVGIDDELVGDAVGDTKGRGIDVSEKNIIDRPNEWRDSRDFLLPLGQK